MKESQLMLVNPLEFGLTEEKSLDLTSDLTPILQERNVLAESYKLVIGQEITPELLTQSRELRLKIQKNRTQGIEKWHKTTKDFFLTGGRFVDAIKNKAILENTRMEENLLEIEKHFENLEKERIQKLQDLRIELVRPYLESVGNLVLSSMENDVFEAYLKIKKDSFETEQEAKKQIELNRLEAIRVENERLENQRLENEKLKKEAELKEAELKAERQKAKDLIIENEKKAKIEEQKRQAEFQAIEREKQEAIRIEREKSEKIQAELNAKKEAELKVENERKSLEEKAKKEAEKLAKAPIKKQLNAWVETFDIPIFPIDNDLASDIQQKFDAFKKWSLSQIENL